MWTLRYLIVGFAALTYICCEAVGRQHVSDFGNEPQAVLENGNADSEDYYSVSLRSGPRDRGEGCPRWFEGR